MAKLLPAVSRGGAIAKISQPTAGGFSSPLAGRFLDTKKKVITLESLFKDKSKNTKDSQKQKAKIEERERR